MSEELFDAISDNNMDTLKTLLKDGDDVNYHCNYDQGTALHEAIRINNLEAVKILIEAGADLGAENIFGETPRMLLNEETNQEIKDLLKDPGHPKRFLKFLDAQKGVIRKRMEKLKNLLDDSEEVKVKLDHGNALLTKIDNDDWIVIIDKCVKIITNCLKDEKNQERVEFEWDVEAEPAALFMNVDGNSSYIKAISEFYERKIKEYNWININWRYKDTHNDLSDHDLWFNIFFAAIYEAIYLAKEKDDFGIEKIVTRYHYDMDWIYISTPGRPLAEWRI